MTLPSTLGLRASTVATSFHHADDATGQWQIAAVVQDESRYFIPSLPGDPPAKLEIPADRAHDPKILSTLAKYRPPLSGSSANTPREASPVNRKRRSVSMLGDEQDGDLVGDTHDCDQVRRKIRRLVDSGMKVTEFANSIGISTPAYYRFMGQNGAHKGAGSDTYTNALRYFQKCESPGIPLTALKKARSERSESPASALSVSPAPSATSTSAIPSAADIAAAHAAISLDSEYSDSVPVYDTCDDIRRKINAYLQKSSEPQASFLRTLMSQYHTQTKTIQSVQLQRFRNMKGPDAGNTNPVYYAAYVFFEKERLRMDKTKSEGRKKLEAIYPSGMDTDKPARKGTWTSGNSNVTKNRYGQWVVDGRILNG
ncbi:hypothetical protein FKW77_003311 [Venturia effusa]|uniref:DUF7726 domain-containing protein n=1 Tax=Venturia effusa TaxID=50376 RepID=A0A517L8X3_9PEZI|nr:hypothetical protein FKW77_003311 [Venturia effusa]